MAKRKSKTKGKSQDGLDLLKLVVGLGTEICVFARVMTKDGAKAMLIWDLAGETFCALGENAPEAVRLAKQLTEDAIEDAERLLKGGK